jgi:Zn-finger nucleic acid-binding protein
MSDRSGVEIDYCPQCRGVWLDRGELDKIIERSADYEQRASLNVPPQSPGERRQEPRYEFYDDDDDRYYDDNRQRPPGKRKRSFLGDMFDIFD